MIQFHNNKNQRHDELEIWGHPLIQQL